MYDLIGFWTVVTLATLVVVIPIVILLYWSTDWVLYKASRKRFDLLLVTANTVYGNKYPYRRCDVLHNKICNTFFAFILVLALLGFIFCGITAELKLEPTNLVEFVGGAATILAPSFGWVGMVGSVFTVVFFVSRKVFDFCYMVKDKLDKLGE